MLRLVREWLRSRAARELPQHLRDARRGEDLAYDHLRRLGYTVVARNYRPRKGKQELDLVAWDQDRLVAVEVKTRHSEEFGRPESAVDTEKRHNIVHAAADYARRAGVEVDRLRFDIVSIILAQPPQIDVYKNAFSQRSIAGRRWF